MHGEAALLEFFAEDVDGGFAFGLFLLAHLPGAGTGDVNHQHFGREALNRLLDLADTGIRQLIALQRGLVGNIIGK